MLRRLQLAAGSLDGAPAGLLGVLVVDGDDLQRPRQIDGLVGLDKQAMVLDHLLSDLRIRLE